MNKLPIINIEIFIKSSDISQNCEVFTYIAQRDNTTWHYLKKNNDVDGIVIKCDGNPFNVNPFYTIINLKS